MNNKTIDQKIQRAEQEITRLEHQKKIKQHEAKQLERNRRNRRIFTRGGMLLSFPTLTGWSRQATHKPPTIQLGYTNVEQTGSTAGIHG